MSSSTLMWARARDSGAGPRIFLPWALYWEPWPAGWGAMGWVVGGIQRPRRQGSEVDTRSIQPSLPMAPCISIGRGGAPSAQAGRLPQLQASSAARSQRTRAPGSASRPLHTHKGT